MNAITSLYANGPARIEVGRWGLPPKEALTRFLNTAKEVGLPDPHITQTEESIRVDFYHHGHKFDPEKYAKLLCKVAHVLDLHGDAPWEYDLESIHCPEGEYILTGAYND